MQSEFKSYHVVIFVTGDWNGPINYYRANLRYAYTSEGILPAWATIFLFSSVYVQVCLVRNVNCLKYFLTYLLN